MSGGYALGSVANVTDIGTNTSGSNGTLVNGSASANTKGAWTQLVASTGADASGFWIFAGNTALANQVTADIGIGAAGSEQVLAGNLQFSLTDHPTDAALVPLQIPAGTRVSVRLQSASASDSARVSIILMDASFDGQGYQTWDDYGYNPATSFGTTVDPGGTANTKGSYVALTSGTARDISAIAWMVDMNGNTPVGADMLLDIAIGAAGSEQIIVPNWNMKNAGSGSTAAISPVYSGPIPVQIPAGTRIAARAQSTDSSATSRKFGLTLYGIA